VTVDGVGVQSASIGSPGFQLDSAELQYLMTFSYMKGPLDVTLTARGIGSGVYSNSYVECAPGSCPVVTAERSTVNDNYIESMTYFDLSFNYQIGNGRVFFAAQNLLDEDPPRLATTNFWGRNSNNKYYDPRG